MEHTNPSGRASVHSVHMICHARDLRSDFELHQHCVADTQTHAGEGPLRRQSSGPGTRGVAEGHPDDPHSRPKCIFGVHQGAFCRACSANISRARAFYPPEHGPVMRRWGGEAEVPVEVDLGPFYSLGS